MRSLVAFLLAFAVTGCGWPDNANTDTDHHDHDHDHEHEAEPEGHDDDHGGHSHVAPHGGLLVELGDHAANIELVLDAEAGTLTAYLLGAHAEAPVRSDAASVDVTVQVDGKDVALKLLPVADALSGEKAGDTSTFRVQDDRLKGGKVHGGRIDPLRLRGVDFETTRFTWPAD